MVLYSLFPESLDPTPLFSQLLSPSFNRTAPFGPWSTFACHCDHYLTPVLFTKTSQSHDSQHLLDQYFTSHVLWCWLLCFLYPNCATERWWILWLAMGCFELFELVEAHVFTTYDNYRGDSFVNSFGDFWIANLVGVRSGRWLVRRLTPKWRWFLFGILEAIPILDAEVGALRRGEWEWGKSARIEPLLNWWPLEGGPHVFFFGHWQGVCDVRADCWGCGIAFLWRFMGIVLVPRLCYKVWILLVDRQGQDTVTEMVRTSRQDIGRARKKQ